MCTDSGNHEGNRQPDEYCRVAKTRDAPTLIRRLIAELRPLTPAMKITVSPDPYTRARRFKDVLNSKNGARLFPQVFDCKDFSVNLDLDGVNVMR